MHLTQKKKGGEMGKRAFLTRRSFLANAAVTGIAAGFAGTGGVALAESAETSAAAASQDVQHVRSCCRACGKCECGVWVTVSNGRVIRVEGDPTSFQSGGNCCSKSQASIQAAYHPDRLRYPMKRTTPKGEDPGWQRITWDEAWDIFSTKVQELTDRYGSETFMNMNGTSRVWANTGSTVQTILGTPNNFSAGHICKGPRQLAGTYTEFFGSYWLANTDEIDNRVYVQWGTACEYSNYDDSCRTVSNIARHAKAHILVDPRMTPLGKEADIWLPVRPGTDGALAMAWTKIVLDHDLYDDLFVKRWTNAPFLVCDDIDPTGYYVEEGRSASTIATRLLKESDIKENGSPKRYIVYDALNECFTYFDVETCMWEGESFEVPTQGRTICDGFVPDPSQFNPPKDPAIYGEFEVTLKDGTVSKVRPVWEHFVERFEEYTPERAAEITGCKAEDIEKACLTWATRIDPSLPNGGIHFQLATDQCGNAIQTIRTLLLLQDICGCIDNPGCGRGPTAGPVKASPTFIYPKGPTRLTDQFLANEKMVGGDKFPMTRWYDEWADTTSLWDAVLSSEPYPVRGNVAATGNFMSMANSQVAWDALASLDFFFMVDLWQVPQAGMADVLVPAAHWLEQNFPRLSQGPSGGMGATVKCIDPPGEALPEPLILVAMAKARNSVWNIADAKNNPWPDYQFILDDAVAGYKGYTWDQFNEEFQKNGWWNVKEVAPERWGTYRRYETGQLHTPGGFGIRPLIDNLPGFWTPTRKVEIWSTIIETFVKNDEYILPSYQEPWKSPVSTPELFEEYPFNLTTGARNPTFFHSEHRQLPWCRELWPVPRVEINPEDAAELGIQQGDWVWIENDLGRVRQVADLYYGIGRKVANANHTWWYPELCGPKHGFDLSNINMLVHKDDQDPICGAAALRAYPVKIYKATPDNCPNGQVIPCDEQGTPIIASADDPRLKEWLPDYDSKRGEAL